MVDSRKNVLEGTWPCAFAPESQRFADPRLAATQLFNRAPPGLSQGK